MNLPTTLGKGQYAHVLVDERARPFIRAFVKYTLVSQDVGADEPNNPPRQSQAPEDIEITHAGADAAAKCVGIAALAGFLQANVTGPVLESAVLVEQLWAGLEHGTEATTTLRQACYASLDVDGVSVYPYIKYVEMFCLARWVFLNYFDDGRRLSEVATTDAKEEDDGEERENDPAESILAWLRLRIHSWHYKLLMEPNPGPGSVFNRMTQWSDLPSLQESIQACLNKVQEDMDTGAWRRQAQVQFLLEKTNVYSMLGLDNKAREALDMAARANRFAYALSGALGKRTRFQEKSTSQLVILAKSALESSESKLGLGDVAGADEKVEAVREAVEEATPKSLPLNNDTLFENIVFTDTGRITGPGGECATEECAAEGTDEHTQTSAIPPSLRDLLPGKQPQLSPLDQIILLSAATLKDAFSPADALTLEEILPYATRVLSDKVANWQIYSQALIVRSRIEMHRSRTVERGVLQMQAVVDQVVVAMNVADTTEEDMASDEKAAQTSGPPEDFPSTQVSKSNEDSVAERPTTFFPAAKPSEQAPPQVRLRYIHALATPPRWHLESELAFAWAGIGSLASALEIFKRLRLWAEVALCLASCSAADDEGGRGAGGEEKARALVRWQLFRASEASLEPKGGEDGSGLDIQALRSADFYGAERNPPPPNAPRLFCILGDIESEPKHYERAWELSEHCYSRAQRSLGEHHLQQHNWDKAREAYMKAVGASRLNPQLWSRLGDINLRLGFYADAADAFGRAIAAASDTTGGEDARTWSNLGSSLYSLYTETVAKQKRKEGDTDTGKDTEKGGDTDVVPSSDGDGSLIDDTDHGKMVAEGTEPGADRQGEDTEVAVLLSRALAAFKRGATISHDNWRIWDNVVTLASRMCPPAIGDMVLGLRNILTLRNTEKAVDAAILRSLLSKAVLTKPRPANGSPARGSQEKAVCDLVEVVVVPLITNRSELWEIVARERVWRGDLGGAIDATEKGWRATIGGASSGLPGVIKGGASVEEGGEEDRNWLESAHAWNNVVARTEELVSVLEEYGPEVATVGSRWKVKARSAVRSVMGKGKERWEGSTGWTTLEGLMESLR